MSKLRGLGDRTHRQTIYTIETTPHIGTCIFELDINWYMLLVCISISLRLIIQVKLEDIIMPQNTCALETACFWVRHTNVWMFLMGVLLGMEPMYLSVVFFIIYAQMIFDN